MMKKITFLFVLFVVSIGYAQSLPIDFESSTTWADFDGGEVTTIANPESNADNNSANVGQMVKNAGETWGGSSLVLSSAMDFDNNNTFTMKAYTIKAGTKVLLKVEDSANAALFYEQEVTMTTTNAWEELTFNYAGINTANSYDKLVVIFDNGTSGDGSANFTFYMDDIVLSNVSGTCSDGIQNGSETGVDCGGSCAPCAAGLTLPLDFETAPVQADINSFDGANATVEAVAAPQSTGNTSTNLVKLVRDGGQVWAGASIDLGSSLDFTTDTTITLKVWTDAPVGTPVGLKAEEQANRAGNFLELITNTTVTGEWETLSWDFSSAGASAFDSLVFLFDLGNLGDGTASSTFYFDDVQQGAPSGPTCTDGIQNGTETGIDCGGSCPNSCLDQIDLPVDFEGVTTDYTVTDFGGNASSVVVDPTNAGNMVIQSIKTAASETWAGTTIGNDPTAAALATDGFASAIPITMSDTKMNIRVWSPTAGTPVRLKIENALDVGQTCETEVLTTVAGAWEVMEFDFANEVPATASLATGFANGWVYSKATIFFDFGTSPTTDTTYYFDDVAFGAALSVKEFNNEQFRTYPNPTRDNWKVQSQNSQIETIRVFNVLGKQVWTLSTNSREAIIDGSSLKSGLYFAQIKTNSSISSIKLIKK